MFISITIIKSLIKKQSNFNLYYIIIIHNSYILIQLIYNTRPCLLTVNEIFLNVFIFRKDK